MEMEKVVAFFYEQVRFIRSSTITSALVETIRVNCYGQDMPLKNVAYCLKLDNNISVEPFDRALLNQICNSLKQNGLDSYIASKIRIIVNVPLPCGEEREKVHKHIRELGEAAKIAVRQIRKKQKTKQNIEQIQKETDLAIAEVDEIVRKKIEEI